MILPVFIDYVINLNFFVDIILLYGIAINLILSYITLSLYQILEIHITIVRIR
ncbi:hypothetical protein C2G38_2102878 [Gigaspora rosea]|uniref:Uncharacterized protein n=1 Tax=Gigaspora rosea TaxID=44941 RepID=A0A397UNA3_9GLOM|nr:hypothetical protein C2G38_2102878 [Gigaspora rosea]